MALNTDVVVHWSSRMQCEHTRLAFMQFAQKMANRLLMGQLRYGPPEATKRYLTRMKLEMAAYRRTGNAEHLYNIANYAVLETIAPENKRFHFDGAAESATRKKMGGERE